MNFDSVKDKVYPWIKVVYSLSEPIAGSNYEVELIGENAPLYQNWLGNLAIFYVVDDGDKFNLLLERDIPLDLTIEQLHSLAVANLNRDVDFEFSETIFGGYGIIAGGDHETGSLCIDGIWQWCSEQLQDNLVVAVPAKDIIMMVPLMDNEKINTLKQTAIEYFEDSERPLTKQLYLFDRNKSDWAIYGSYD